MSLEQLNVKAQSIKTNTGETPFKDAPEVFNFVKEMGGFSDNLTAEMKGHYLSTILTMFLDVGVVDNSTVNMFKDMYITSPIQNEVSRIKKYGLPQSFKFKIIVDGANKELSVYPVNVAEQLFSQNIKEQIRLSVTNNFDMNNPYAVGEALFELLANIESKKHELLKGKFETLLSQIPYEKSFKRIYVKDNKDLVAKMMQLNEEGDYKKTSNKAKDPILSKDMVAFVPTEVDAELKTSIFSYMYNERNPLASDKVKKVYYIIPPKSWKEKGIKAVFADRRLFQVYLDKEDIEAVRVTTQRLTNYSMNILGKAHLSRFHNCFLFTDVKEASNQESIEVTSLSPAFNLSYPVRSEITVVDNSLESKIKKITANYQAINGVKYTDFKVDVDNEGTWKVSNTISQAFEHSDIQTQPLLVQLNIELKDGTTLEEEVTMSVTNADVLI